MAGIRLNKSITDAVSEAVIFSARTEGSPVTRNRILLSSGGGKLTVTAAGIANSTFSRTTECPVEGAPAEAVVNGASLAGILNTAGEDAALTVTDSAVVLNEKNASVKLYSVSAEEAAAFRGYVGIGGPAGAPEPAAVLPFEKLRTGIREVIYARSRRSGPGSYAVSGVTVRCEKGRFSAWALDSSRAASFSCGADGTLDCCCVIPPDIASFIASGRWPGTAPDERCLVSMSGNRFTLRAGPAVLSSPTVSGAVFDIERIIGPGRDSSTFTLSAGDLLRTVDRILSVAPPGDRKSARGALTLVSSSPDGLAFSYLGQTGEIRETVKAGAALSPKDRAAGSGCRLGLNAALLKECLSSMKDREIRMSADLSNGSAPVLFSPSPEDGAERVHLILPVFINRGL